MAIRLASRGTPAAAASTRHGHGRVCWDSFTRTDIAVGPGRRLSRQGFGRRDSAAWPYCADEAVVVALSSNVSADWSTC